MICCFYQQKKKKKKKKDKTTEISKHKHTRNKTTITQLTVIFVYTFTTNDYKSLFLFFHLGLDGGK